MKPTLLVLAAGMGSRYGSLKQVDAFGPSGETIIDYSIYDAIQAGFGKVVFVIRKHIEKEFKEVFGNRFSDQIEVAFVYQELENIPQGYDIHSERQKPWGTAHAVWMAKDAIETPFAVINSDDFYGRDAYIKIGAYLQSVPASDTLHYAMVGYQLKNTLSDFGSVNRGVCVTDADGLLTSVTECTGIQRNEEGIIQYPDANGQYHTLTEDTPVSMNMWGCPPAIFDEINSRFEAFLAERGSELKSEYYIPTLITELIEEGIAQVKMLTTDASWFGVTYQDDKPVVIESLNKLVNEGVYPSPLWEKVSQLDT